MPAGLITMVRNPEVGGSNSPSTLGERVSSEAFALLSLTSSLTAYSVESPPSATFKLRITSIWINAQFNVK